MLFSALAARAARRPLLTLSLFGALAIACAIAALGLRPTAATDTLVGRSSSAYQATQSFHAKFGEEPVEVLVKGDLRKLVLSSDIDRLLGLEGCLSGRVPAAALAREGGSSGPCAQLARSHAVRVVFGPGTFINEAAIQIDNMLAARRIQAEGQAAQARSGVRRAALAKGLGIQQAETLAGEASRATMSGFAAEISALAIRYGLSAPPSLDDHSFVSALVFDSTKPSGTPKQRFAYLFPGREAALISVRLQSGLSESQRAHAIELIRRSVAMGQWRLANGESYYVTGEPAIVSDLAASISRSIELLMIAVLVVMAVCLSLIFRSRPRLLPLGIALLAAALTFGALSISGASLTIASVAVLPVLVGLAVDYAIQFQSQIAHELGSAGPGRPSRDELVRAVSAAASKGAPAIATAAFASVAGMLVLLLSPVPMVRGFGLLLVLGIALAFVCALSAGSAAMVLARSGALSGFARGRFAHRRDARGSGPLADAWQGAREILSENPLTRLIAVLALDRAVRRPGRVLAAGLALAALGWALDTRIAVQTDIAKLAPSNLASLRGLDALERASGVGGQIDLMVSSSKLTAPSTIEWMSSYEQSVLRRFGYTSTRGCGHADLCPAFSLPDLFQTAASPSSKLTQAQIDGLLSAVPPYFSQGVITADRHVATIAFGIRLMGLDSQQRLIEGMQAALRPPPGVHAQLVGLSVLAAQSAAQISSPWHRMLTLLLTLAVVALVLLVLFRGEPRRALVPLVPLVLATGWSSLLQFAVGVPLNPMSVTLGTLVIAVSTEFSVLLSERHRREMLAGKGVSEALRAAYRHTGAAVAASGVTAIAGFGVLALSDIAMLREFGIATLIDLSVALLGVLVALPAAVVLAHRRTQPVPRAARAALSP
jgi:uncharacterized protein